MGLPAPDVAGTTDDIPAPLWQVIELLYFGKLSQAQIAEQLDLPIDAVRARTILAMRHLRRALGGSS